MATGWSVDLVLSAVVSGIGRSLSRNNISFEAWSSRKFTLLLGLIV